MLINTVFHTIRSVASVTHPAKLGITNRWKFSRGKDQDLVASRQTLKKFGDLRPCENFAISLFAPQLIDSLTTQKVSMPQAKSNVSAALLQNCFRTYIL